LRVSVAIAVGVLLAAATAACGASPTPSQSPPTASTASTGSPPATSTPSASDSAPTIASSGAAADAALLGFIPASAVGLTIAFDPETTAAELGDPNLDANVATLATGIATPLNAAASPNDLVIVNVVRLRDPAVTDDWFRSWRDSYDAAACEPAGGLSGHATSKINGRDVFIGSCAGGARTYHLRLEAGAVLVSLTSIGTARLGERLVEVVPAG
jgi:hypothetical protein